MSKQSSPPTEKSTNRCRTRIVGDEGDKLLQTKVKQPKFKNVKMENVSLLSELYNYYQILMDKYNILTDDFMPYADLITKWGQLVTYIVTDFVNRFKVYVSMYRSLKT